MEAKINERTVLEDKDDVERKQTRTRFAGHLIKIAMSRITKEKDEKKDRNQVDWWTREGLDWGRVEGGREVEVEENRSSTTEKVTGIEQRSINGEQKSRGSHNLWGTTGVKKGEDEDILEEEEKKPETMTELPV